MDRINRILAHPQWKENVALIRELEKDRVFCSHTVEHFLDVARLGYIEILENHREIPKDRIYAAALLHDIGRGQQYRDGTPHDLAGAGIARDILRDCGFSEEEIGDIVTAILGHRNPDTRTRQDLAGVLYRADKASRMCLFCQVQKECNWSDEKKNLVLRN